MQALSYRSILLSLALVSGPALPAPARPAPRQDATATIARLVPEDATIYVRAGSLDALDKFMRDMMRATEPEKLEGFDVRELVAGMQVPGDLAHVDAARPLALAVSLSMQGPPIVTAIVPVKDAAAYKASLGGLGSTELEGYVGVSSVAGYAARGGPHPLAVGLPDGVVALRLDLEAILEMYAPMIEMVMTQIEQLALMAAETEVGGMDLGPIIDWYIACFEDFIDSADVLDAGLLTRGDELDAGFVLKVFPDSPLAKCAGSGETGVAKLAACIDPADPLVFLGGVDFAAMMERMEGLIEPAISMYPEAFREQMRTMMKSFEGMYPLLGTAFAGSGGFSADGMRFAYFLESKEPAKLIEAYGQAFGALAGSNGLFTMEGPVAEKRGEVALTRYHLRFTEEGLKAMTEDVAELDPESAAEMRKMIEFLYGKDGVRFAMAGQGNRVLFTLGGDDAFLDGSLRRLAATGPAAGPVQPVLARIAGANPSMVMRMDIAVLMNEMLALAPMLELEMPEEPPDLTGLSAPMLFWGGIRSTEWSGGASFDLKKLAALVAAMKG